MREALVGMALFLVLIVAGCGRGDHSGFTRDEIFSALGLHRKFGDEIHYEWAPGKDCVVDQLLTNSDQVDAAKKVAAGLPTALAVNSDGDAGVIFIGYGTFSQHQCVAPAESDLNSLSK